MLKLVWKTLWVRRRRNGWLLAELTLVTIVSWIIFDPVIVSLYDRHLPLSLMGKILSVLPDCLIPDEKIHELMKQENALDTLYQLCQSISECDAFEINDIISSCRSFIG